MMKSSGTISKATSRKMLIVPQPKFDRKTMANIFNTNVQGLMNAELSR